MISELITFIRVKRAVKKTLVNKETPRIIDNVQGAYDPLYGRSEGVLLDRTTNAIPKWVFETGKNWDALRKTGYMMCSTCSGDGWDADCGGYYVCPECGGKGIVDGRALCKCGHMKSEHYMFTNRVCLHGVNSGEDYPDGYPCSCNNFDSIEG